MGADRSASQNTRVWDDQAYRGQRVVIREHAPKARDFTNRRYRHRGVVDEVERAKNRTKSKVRAWVGSYWAAKGRNAISRACTRRLEKLSPDRQTARRNRFTIAECRRMPERGISAGPLPTGTHVQGSAGNDFDGHDATQPRRRRAAGLILTPVAG